jgi:hypothetical protein
MLLVKAAASLPPARQAGCIIRQHVAGRSVSERKERAVHYIREAQQLDTSHLTKTRDMLIPDVDGWRAKGARVSLRSDLRSVYLGNVLNAQTWGRLRAAIAAIGLAEGDMLTVMERLEWMRVRAQQDEHIRSHWSAYAGADIEYWHVNLRSLLDHVGMVISELADKKNQVSDMKFHRLYRQSRPNAANIDEFGKRIGPDWLALLQRVTWFELIVSVRNELLHYGGQTMVFESPSHGILFQIHGSRYPFVVMHDPSLMYNKNVVYFDRYAAFLMSHVISFLEEFAAIVYKRTGIFHSPEGTVRACNIGYGVLHSWIESALTAASR